MAEPGRLQNQHLGQGREPRVPLGPTGAGFHGGGKGTVFLLDGRSDMEFLEVLTERLDRVMLVRGGGREVITNYT